MPLVKYNDDLATDDRMMQIKAKFRSTDEAEVLAEYLVLQHQLPINRGQDCTYFRLHSLPLFRCSENEQFVKFSRFIPWQRFSRIIG